MRALRPNAGFSRAQWRVMHGIAIDGRFPRYSPRELERSPGEIMTELRDQLETMWKHWPAEFR